MFSIRKMTATESVRCHPSATWPPYTNISRKKQLAKQLSFYLHGHQTEVWTSLKGYRLIKVTRCETCAGSDLARKVG